MYRTSLFKVKMLGAKTNQGQPLVLHNEKKIKMANNQKPGLQGEYIVWGCIHVRE
jgi:hypothetical protein